MVNHPSSASVSDFCQGAEGVPKDNTLLSCLICEPAEKQSKKDGGWRLYWRRSLYLWADELSILNFFYSSPDPGWRLPPPPRPLAAHLQSCRQRGKQGGAEMTTLVCSLWIFFINQITLSSLSRGRDRPGVKRNRAPSFWKNYQKRRLSVPPKYNSDSSPSLRTTLWFLTIRHPNALGKTPLLQTR